MADNPNALGALIRQRGLLFALAGRELKKRTVGSLLGFLWLFLQPLATLALFTFVFSVAMGGRGLGPMRGVSYTVFILTGFLPWLIAQEALQRGSVSILENAALVKRVRFPTLFLPTASMLAAGAFGLFWLTPALIYLALAHRLAAPSWLALTLLYPLWLLFLWGLAVMLAVAAAHVRDVLQALGFGLMALMYASPIFYPTQWLPQPYRGILAYNPMAPFIESFRAALMLGQWPQPGEWMRMAAVALLSAALGWTLHAWGRRALADAL